MAILGGRIRGDYLELAQYFERGSHCRLALAADDDRNSIQQYLVRPANASVGLEVVRSCSDHRSARGAEALAEVVARRNAGRQSCQTIGVAAIQRQLVHLLRADGVVQR